MYYMSGNIILLRNPPDDVPLDKRHAIDLDDVGLTLVG